MENAKKSFFIIEKIKKYRKCPTLLLWDTFVPPRGGGGVWSRERVSRVGSWTDCSYVLRKMTKPLLGFWKELAHSIFKPEAKPSGACFSANTFVYTVQGLTKFFFHFLMILFVSSYKSY